MTIHFLSYRFLGVFALLTRVYHARTRVHFYSLLIVVFLLCPGSLSADRLSRPEAHGSPAPRRAPLPPADPGLMVSFDFEGPVFIEDGALIKDHAFISVDGVYHIIYITDNERSFGHASSTDLTDWTIHDRVMSAGPDHGRIWAPSIIEFEDMPGYYLMYYTGVNSSISQKTYLAFSTGDLSKWIPAIPERFEPFHPDTGWASWSEDSWSNCRDPHFFIDDDGTNYLVNTATHRDGSGAISLASSDWYFDWTDMGPLYKHSNWHALESPFLMKHDGRYHIFFVEEEIGGISHMSSPTLTGGWNIIYRAIIDNGHACELLPTGDGRYLFSRHSSYVIPSGGTMYSIRIDTLGWFGDLPEVSMEDPLGPDWTILRGNAFDRQPVFGDQYGFRGIDTVSAGFEGNWWIGTAESFDGPIMGSTPGSFQGDVAAGAIRSKTFTVTGRSMRLLVGGGCYPEACYVALCDASSGDPIYSETGRGTETMDERIWDLEPLRGRQVYLEIVDDSSLPFGHINVDGIRESPFPMRPWPYDPEENDPGKDILDPKKEEMLSGNSAGSTLDEPVKDDVDLPGTNNINTTETDDIDQLETDNIDVPEVAVLGCCPNPFNPSTTIRLKGLPSSSYEMAIYDIAGRLVTRLHAETSPAGEASVNWNGISSSGDLCASGMYIAAAVRAGNIHAITKLILMR